jgi:type IV pilus assembly protein PilC
MAKYQFVALDAKGKEIKGVVEAESDNAALAGIRKKGLFPTSVEQAAGRARKSKSRSAAGTGAAKKGGGMSMEIKLPRLSNRIKAKQLMTFTRQLSTLINAGLPLIRGLQVVERQEKNPLLKEAVINMADSIQAGSTLADAMSQYPKIFNRLYVNMVKAGEVGGILDQILDRLAEFMEKSQAIKSKVISAMVYPVVVLLMAVGIVTFLMIVIIPKFEAIFNDLLEGAALPPLTQFVMNLSDLLTRRSPYVIAGIVVLVVAIKLIGKTEGGRYFVDKAKLKMPVFGNLTQKTAIATFARTLGTLMRADVPVLQALTIVRDTATNAVIARAAENVHDSVKEGENMAPPIEAAKVFPPMVVSMIEVGEETGKLPDMMLKIADTYDDEVDNAVNGLTSVIEPLLIIFLALIVGTIVIALFMPMVSIIGKLS